MTTGCCPCIIDVILNAMSPSLQGEDVMFVAQYIITLSSSEHHELERLIRGHNTPQKLVRRARIVLESARGTSRCALARQ